MNDARPYAIAAGISLFYDATVLKPVKVSASPIISDYYLKYNIGIASQGSQGEIRMAFIGMKSADSNSSSPLIKGARGLSLQERESLLYIEFEALPFTSGKNSPLILNTVDLSGSTGITKRHGFVEILPSKTELLPNYPNPFNPETWIPYRLSDEADVTVYIYDSRGQLVRSFFLGTNPAGTYLDRGKAVYWDGKNNAGERVASGVYFYQLKAGRFSDTRKLAVMK
ncbi:T9SS type A sorting domain-containing protein [Candidatus Poribacteria bacterium]|nr:T9SS type A sorting domain-containing protein [Candidatus Poribacteria bacterium]